MEQGIPNKTRAFKKPEKINAGQITFLCEQDGVPEREIKRRLIKRFTTDIHVLRAYLARMRYESSAEERVALCLRIDSPDLERIVGQVAADFTGIFEQEESMEIVFLSEAQEQALSLRAAPFYQQELRRS